VYRFLEATLPSLCHVNQYVLLLLLLGHHVSKCICVYKNSWTDAAAVWREDSCWFKEPWESRSPTWKGTFEGTRAGRPIVICLPSTGGRRRYGLLSNYFSFTHHFFLFWFTSEEEEVMGEGKVIWQKAISPSRLSWPSRQLLYRIVSYFWHLLKFIRIYSNFYSE